MKKLLKIDGFEIWVNTRAGGLHKRLLERAEKLRRNQDPGPEREPEFNWMIREELKELFKIWENRKDRLIIYDLGANIGHNSLIMNHTARNYFKGDYFIYAIEPEPNNLKFLELNLRHNQVPGKAVFCAIADYTGKGWFHRSSNLKLGALLPTQKTDAGTIEVNVYTLPDFARTIANAQPNFIKMDIEGGEVEVLKASREFFKNCSAPIKIIMEVHPTEYTAERSLEKELQFLFENGWRPKYIASEGTARPPQFQKAGLKPFLEFSIPTHSPRRIKSRGIYREFSIQNLLDFACQKNEQELPWGKKIERIVRSILIEKL